MIWWIFGTSAMALTVLHCVKQWQLEGFRCTLESQSLAAEIAPHKVNLREIF